MKRKFTLHSASQLWSQWSGSFPFELLPILDGGELQRLVQKATDPTHEDLALVYGALAIDTKIQ